MCGVSKRVLDTPVLTVGKPYVWISFDCECFSACSCTEVKRYLLCKENFTESQIHWEICRMQCRLWSGRKPNNRWIILPHDRKLFMTVIYWTLESFGFKPFPQQWLQRSRRMTFQHSGDTNGCHTHTHTQQKHSRRPTSAESVKWRCAAVYSLTRVAWSPTFSPGDSGDLLSPVQYKTVPVWNPLQEFFQVSKAAPLTASSSEPWSNGQVLILTTWCRVAACWHYMDFA